VTTLQSGSATVVGQVRAANEDSHQVTDRLAVVADGMGGHRGGAVASATTVRVVAGSPATTLEELVAAVQQANRQVFDDARSNADLRGMGTTVCLVGLVDHDGVEELAVLNVGDSRVYLLASGVVEQLTEDHSLVETLVREGRLSPEDAEVHPQRNVLTRALGVDSAVAVDAWLLRPADGDRLLLCSDGLFNEVAEDRMAELLAEPDAPELVARRLCAEADAAGGRDNITVVVVDVADVGHPPAPLVERYRRFSTPSVDLFGDDDGPHTDTVLAVVGTGSPQGEAAPVPETAAEPPTPSTTAADAESAAPAATTGASPPVVTGADDGAARRSWWRVAAFAAAVLGVVALAVAAITLFGRQGYFLDTAGDEVTVFSGQTWGRAWFAPEAVDPTGFTLEDLTENGRREVVNQKRFNDVDEARNFVTLNTTTTTTTTSTTTTTTTTLLPPLPPGIAPPPVLPAPPGP